MASSRKKFTPLGGTDLLALYRRRLLTRCHRGAPFQGAEGLDGGAGYQQQLAGSGFDAGASTLLPAGSVLPVPEWECSLRLGRTGGVRAARDSKVATFHQAGGHSPHSFNHAPPG